MSESNGKAQAADGASESPEAGTSDSASERARLQEEADKFKNEYLYLRAEFDNYKKHSIKERSDLVKYGAERLARDIIVVLDNFERALSLKITPENMADFSKGVELTAHELRNTLQKHGIHEHPSQDVPFDPSHHEALSSEVSTSHPEGHVMRVFQKAYKFHDRLLRPAHVVVAKKPGA